MPILWAIAGFLSACVLPDTITAIKTNEWPVAVIVVSIAVLTLVGYTIGTHV